MKFQFIRKKPTLKQRVEILKKLDLKRMKESGFTSIVRTLDEYEVEWLRKDAQIYGVLAYLDETKKTRKNKQGLGWLYLTKEQFDYAIEDCDDAPTVIQDPN
jgi:hypothetical protein